MVEHHFKPVRWTGNDGMDQKPSSEPTTFKADDLTNKATADFGGLAKALTSKGLVQYVLLQRVRATGGTWILPTEQQFHDAMTSIECQLVCDAMEILQVLQWANMWDAVGIIGLSTTNLPLLKEFLSFIGNYGDGVMEFTTIPKEFVVEDSGLTTILRNVHRRLDLGTFPMVLFHRNPGLRGGELYVTHSKCYGAGDKTRAGQPKEGWRLLFLKGCPTFLKKLSQYPESHRFTLGSSGIQIWGGVRKEEDGSWQQKRKNNASRRGGGQGGGGQGGGGQGGGGQGGSGQRGGGRGGAAGRGIGAGRSGGGQGSGGGTGRGGSGGSNNNNNNIFNPGPSGLWTMGRGPAGRGPIVRGSVRGRGAGSKAYLGGSSNNNNNNNEANRNATKGKGNGKDLPKSSTRREGTAGDAGGGTDVVPPISSQEP